MWKAFEKENRETISQGMAQWSDSFPALDSLTFLIPSPLD